MRLTASEIMGVEVLPPILTDFREAWPKVDIELVLSNRMEDLLRRDADIAVRMARPQQNALFARRIGALNVGLLRPSLVSAEAWRADHDRRTARPHRDRL